MYAQLSGIGSNVKSKQFWFVLTMNGILYLLDNKTVKIQIYISKLDLWFFLRSFLSVTFLMEHWFVPNTIVLPFLLRLR